VADLYLDDCLDGDYLIALLRRAGHTVDSPRQLGTRGIDDPEHLELAAQRNRALVTQNVGDFLELHRTWQNEGRLHGGILLIYQENDRGKDMEPPDIVRAIGNLLASGLPIANQVHVLNHWR
jgi:Domain of unknown function (DUF5615)